MNMRIYALMDIRANYFNSVDLFQNDFIAYREYFLRIEQARTKNPAILHEDFQVIFLGSVSNTSPTPVIEPCSPVKIISKNDIENSLSDIEKDLKGRGLR